jgi:Phosphotransferase enzyme family
MIVDKNAAVQAARQFGTGEPNVELLHNGLINASYKTTYSDGMTLFLQCINQQIFPHPEKIIENYNIVYKFLEGLETTIQIPEMVKTHRGQYHWIDKTNNFWRAQIFFTDSYSSQAVCSAEDVYTAARSFAQFTHLLSGLNANRLNIIIPDFHNLQVRLEQFKRSVKTGNFLRIKNSANLINKIVQRDHLVKFYKTILSSPGYPSRIMHHDCKISNILFNQRTHQVIGPVDLDTVMPGKYFSDLGDMVRTMTCNIDENGTELDQIEIIPAYYRGLIEGYTEGINNSFTKEEKNHLAFSGLLMIFMQAMRFLTDYFMDDLYYHTDYSEQNLIRAKNQLRLLEELESFLNIKR